MRLRCRAGPVNAAAEELFQYVVFVRSQHQAAHRQPHAAGDVAGQYVAEITRRHGKRHLLLQPGSAAQPAPEVVDNRSEEHTSELQSLMRKSYAVFCLKKK